MNFELLNEMIMYIENNLTDKIDYKKLAKITGTNEFILQRIFLFISGISISEYIRKRRLSKAYEELKLTDNKIIDIALKYGYDSHISFARAFKKEFNITPSELKKDKSKTFKGYPIFVFDEKMSHENLEYEIKELEEQVIYCKSVKAKHHDDLSYKIRRLYDNLRSSGLYYEINKYGQYGISSLKINGFYNYYVGCKKRLENFKKVIIPKGKYAVFKVDSRKQKDILNGWDYVYKVWLPSVNYEVKEAYDYELYEEDMCYLYLPIK